MQFHQKVPSSSTALNIIRLNPSQLYWCYILLQNVALIKCPVTILHAKNDKVCPIEGSEKILEDAKKSGKTNIKLVKFQEVGPEGNGHIGISKHKDFDEVIKSAVLDAHNYHEIKE